MTSNKVFSFEEVSRHCSKDDCWIVIDSIVFDVTKFLRSHPGGQGAILAYAGKDATEAFFDLHKKNVLQKYIFKLKIGLIEGAISHFETMINLPGQMDTITPFAEHPFIKGWKSPFYNESHVNLRRAIRHYYDVNIRPDAESMEESGMDPPREVFEGLGSSGIFAARLGPLVMPFVKEMNLRLPGNLNPEIVNFFHQQVAHEECSNLGFYGYADGLGTGLMIGLPPVIHFGKQGIFNDLIKSCILGKKIICLAISEPQAGSDVAGITTTARRSDDGNSYIINGIKKWITNGTFSDYFVTAAKLIDNDASSKKSHSSITLFLIERTAGLTTQKIKTSYGGSAGTALVLFDNVKVHKDFLLGKEGEGFKCIMKNFNQERWLIATVTLCAMRGVLSESYKWAMNRKVFGKKLIDQPVIRNKLAQMTASVESSQAWLDSITFQMNSMDYETQATELGGPIALMKYQITRNALLVSDHACQIFGGRAITRTGMGQMVERFQRSFKFPAIYGGSEEVLADLSIRQAIKSVDEAIRKDNTGKVRLMTKL